MDGTEECMTKSFFAAYLSLSYNVTGTSRIYLARARDLKEKKLQQTARIILIHAETLRRVACELEKAKKWQNNPPLG